MWLHKVDGKKMRRRVFWSINVYKKKNPQYHLLILSQHKHYTVAFFWPCQKVHGHSQISNAPTARCVSSRRSLHFVLLAPLLAGGLVAVPGHPLLAPVALLLLQTQAFLLHVGLHVVEVHLIQVLEAALCHSQRCGGGRGTNS